jgi:chemotaxis protein MotB
MSDEQKGAPDWIVTFSDIVSLLVTFFIMILTWSTLETEEFEMIRGSLQGALGVVGRSTDKASLDRKPQLRNARMDNQGADNPPEDRPSDNPYENLAIRLKRELGEAIDFDKLASGYRIRIGSDALFRAGSAELTPACVRTLDQVARALAPRYNPIRIDGHTARGFRPTPRFPSAWALSAARAAAAARYLVEKGHIEPQRISVAGYASLRPAYRARGAAAEARNRRIEIVILKASSRRG